jgi:hypothetical protein
VGAAQRLQQIFKAAPFMYAAIGWKASGKSLDDL